MARYVTLAREAIVQAALRPAGWHGTVHDDEYERLDAEGAFLPPEPAAPALRRVIRLRTAAEVMGAGRPEGWHGTVSEEEYARLAEAGAVVPEGADAAVISTTAIVTESLPAEEPVGTVPDDAEEGGQRWRSRTRSR